MLEKIFNKIDRVCEFFVGFMLFVLMSVTVISVFFRFVIQYSLFWSDEFLRFGFIWLVFFALPLLVINKGQIAVDIASLVFPKKYYMYACFIGQVTAFISLLLMFFYSLKIINKAMFISSPSLQIPMGVIYLCIPIGLILGAINFIRLMIREINNKYVDDYEEEEEET